MVSLRKCILTGLVCAGAFILGCNDSSNPSSSNGSDPQKMIGSWKVDKVTGSGNDSLYNSVPVVMQITSSQMIMYINIMMCYMSDTTQIDLSGNSVTMDGKNGTVTFSGDKMTVTSSDLGTIEMSKYSGSIPPSDWPKQNCGSILLQN